MNTALWGVVSALGWGSADFVARFTGRALGPDVALFGMLVVGATALTGAVLATSLPPSGTALAWAIAIGSGVAILVATLFLYDGLARGPVTIVAPIASAYPLINIVVGFARGARPEALQWAAMAAVLLGVAIVARSAGQFETAGGLTQKDIRRSVAVALAAAVSFGVALVAAQEVIPVFGEIGTVWLGRIASFALLATVFAARRRAPLAPARWWPLLTLQGLLDTSAYIALLFGGHGPGSEIAVVVASCFSVVTVVLARIFLKEPMSVLQWAGIAAIVLGIGTLTAMGK